MDSWWDSSGQLVGQLGTVGGTAVDSWGDSWWDSSGQLVGQLGSWWDSSGQLVGQQWTVGGTVVDSWWDSSGQLVHSWGQCVGVCAY